MMLITKEIAKKLPVLYANENKNAADTKVPLKLFNPCGAQTWFITEMNPDNGIMFGYVTGVDFPELGYISLEELKEWKHFSGLGIERDRHWNVNNTLEQVMNGDKS